MRPSIEEIKRLLRESPDDIPAILKDIHVEDLADIFSTLEPDEAADLLERMPVEEAAPIFERLDHPEQEELVEHLAPESVVQIASEMAPDDRADLFSVLPEAIGEKILSDLEKVDPQAAEEIREIDKYAPTAAAHLMTTSYVEVSPTMTVEQAISAIKAYGLEYKTPVYNVYAMTERGRLEGIVSLRQLIMAPPFQPLTELINTSIISVPPDLDQEEVARRMAKYDLNVMPVLDETGVILGVITIDDIIDVLTQEQTEDVQKLGGVAPLEAGYFQTGFVEFLKKRGGWLFVLFIGEFFTQTALRHYDGVFEAIKGAAYYIPLLISAGGNSGSQSSTLVIRGLSVGEIKVGDWLRVLVKELSIGLALGLALGIVGFLRVVVTGDSIPFAATVGLTLVGIVTTGCTVGSMLPLIIKRAGLDPATSSTPFIASLVDVAGIVVFVTIAKVVMSGVLRAHGLQ